MNLTSEQNTVIYSSSPDRCVLADAGATKSTTLVYSIAEFFRIVDQWT